MNQHRPPMPEGITMLASRSVETNDGSFPLAWVDDLGNVLPVEQHSLLSLLPPGARYLFTQEELDHAIRPGIYLGATPTVTDPLAMRQATAQAPNPSRDQLPEVSRAQTLSAFNNVLGTPTHQVR